ncbi:hypothetical protein FGO68_gene3665 [Halteria grandinella]|uniref:ABC3 transporter permease C-terminal domain-containing protein n=1 Tax=Halteria grandinella TaxID=5974 RepID=A0A8J8NY59_HALGN|nr:hypothetical protein FGO68_gene3665 [Halteria grandinella]
MLLIPQSISQTSALTGLHLRKLAYRTFTSALHNQYPKFHQIMTPYLDGFIQQVNIALPNSEYLHLNNQKQLFSIINLLAKDLKGLQLRVTAPILDKLEEAQSIKSEIESIGLVVTGLIQIINMLFAFGLIKMVDLNCKHTFNLLQALGVEQQHLKLVVQVTVLATLTLGIFIGQLVSKWMRHQLSWLNVIGTLVVATFNGFLSRIQLTPDMIRMLLYAFISLTCCLCLKTIPMLAFNHTDMNTFTNLSVAVLLTILFCLLIITDTFLQPLLTSLPNSTFENNLVRNFLNKHTQANRHFMLTLQTLVALCIYGLCSYDSVFENLSYSLRAQIGADMQVQGLLNEQWTCGTMCEVSKVYRCKELQEHVMNTVVGQFGMQSGREVMIKGIDGSFFEVIDKDTINSREIENSEFQRENGGYRVFLSENLRGEVFNKRGEIIWLCGMKYPDEKCRKRYKLKIEKVFSKLPGFPSKFTSFKSFNAKIEPLILMPIEDFKSLMHELFGQASLYSEQTFVRVFDPNDLQIVKVQLERQSPTAIILDCHNLYESIAKGFKYLEIIQYSLVLSVSIMICFLLYVQIMLKRAEDAKDFGILRAIGTTQNQMKKIRQKEQLIVSWLAIATGMFLGYSLVLIQKAQSRLLMEMTLISITFNKYQFLSLLAFLMASVYLLIKLT